MIRDDRLALFLLLGQSAERAVAQHPTTITGDALLLGPAYDLAPAVPEEVRRASRASTAYRLFFVFENYLRDLVVEVLTKTAGSQGNWWDLVPPDVQSQVTELEATEEMKAWMSLGSRDKSALMTYPQLLRTIEHCWNKGFDELLRDKALVAEGRLVTHLRNTVAHMTDIPDEETDRIRQVMRDWFRVLAP
jgi:hypothetical protein